MEIIVRREHLNDVCTIGTLTVDGISDLLLYTLEDVDRKLTNEDSVEQIKAVKVFGKTCIPYGRYEVALTYSNKYKRVMPLICNVKGFDGIRIHSGNVASDTEGCLLVGTQKDVLNNRILNSRAAIGELYFLITEKIHTEKVFITFTR